MKYRVLGRTGLSVSVISFGAWAIGGAWGSDVVRGVYDRRVREHVHGLW